MLRRDGICPMTIDVRKLQGKTAQGWLLSEELGSGADGIVYVGTKGDLQAAVKIFFPEEVIKNGVDESMDRLDLQLSLIGQKQHPNLVQIFEGGKASELDDALYLAMELVPGKSLDKVVKVMPREAIAPLIMQLAEAAKFLDSMELTHRDIKPANIIISEDFSKLTLLDLGIILTLGADDDRLSGKEFVATLRYSPREFVWRKEDSSSSDGWRAITFYQIGATLHDMIMRKPLFDGLDQPRGLLYDSVRWHSPEVEANDCSAWLVNLAKSCLVKNWRERLLLLTWSSFLAPPAADDYSYQQNVIRLRQIRSDEIRLAEEVAGEKEPKANVRVTELWELHNRVFIETRQFLMGAQIFPKFSATHTRMSDARYELIFMFDEDHSLMFDNPVIANVFLSTESHEMATELRVVVVIKDGDTLFDAKWIEMLTVESAAARVRQALIEVAGNIVPAN